LRSDFVEHVVEQACEDPVATPALCDPKPSFREAEAVSQLDQLGIGRDDLVERRIRPGDGEGFGLGRRPVAAHLRAGRTALRLRVRSRGTDYGDRNRVEPEGGLFYLGTSFNRRCAESSHGHVAKGDLMRGIVQRAKSGV
jgi:hypothetical protein